MTARPSAGPRVWLVGVLCLLLALLCSASTGWGTPAWWAVPALAAAVAVAELAVVHLEVARQRWTLSLTEAALCAGLVLHVGAWSVVAVAVGVGTAQALRRQPRVKLAFNVAQFCAAAAVAQVTALGAGAGVRGAVVGVAAFWAANHVLVALVVSLTSGRSLRALLTAHACLSAVHTAGNCSIGLLASHLALTSPVHLLGLGAPMALLWSSYDQQARRSAEARLFAQLARGQERATSRTPDASAQVVLTAAARLLSGADVEMLLLAADGPVHYLGHEDGVPSRRRVGPTAFDEPWVLRALAAGGVSSGTEGGRPWCSAVLGQPDSPLAVLVARRAAGAAAFGRRQTALLEVLAGQAQSWLSVADLSARHHAASARAAAAGGAARALGDVAAATAPALTVLRESADRLADLAGTSAVEDLVDELHLVERAVASLLGAVALAAEPDLLGVVPPDPAAPAIDVPPSPTPVRAAAEWTTTGLLR